MLALPSEPNLVISICWQTMVAQIGGIEWYNRPAHSFAEVDAVDVAYWTKANMR